ncbi:unnamed protein product [Zymoseptoria tritici ST99CH_1E4]|uniref:DUF659 domain-containing protein n=1 Tax=Zymoseptoria tritici ST99CH_1E4 TaxID=1276532 RepID=A0A2H1GCL6_ZYMTR|nr:unnamed protein product [Zymoseptoria tritici ST99CH_1E4]SMR54582.1 unnamed protein product [Zymoseptoria tritici ST99CH_1E4]
MPTNSNRRQRQEHACWLEMERQFDSVGQRHPEVTCKHCEVHWISNEKKKVIRHLRKCERLPHRLLKTYQPARLGAAPREPEPVQRPFAPAASMAGVSVMSATHHKEAVNALAEWIFAAGLPLSTTDHPAFQRFMKIAQPALTIPSRRTVTNMLDEQYDALKAEVDAKLQDTKNLTLVTDGWTNRRGHSMINYLAVTPAGEALFVGSRATGIERHTGQNLCDDAARVIEEIGRENVVCVTTDTASNMMSMQKKIREIFTKMTTLGCSSHNLHLAVNEVIKLPAVWAIWIEILDTCKFFKAHPYATAILYAIAESLGCELVAFTLPGKARWQGKHNSGACVLANQVPLQRLPFSGQSLLSQSPSAEDREREQVIKNRLASTAFWSNTAAFIDLLKPFLQVTIALESNSPRLSHVYANYRYLLNDSFANPLLESYRDVHDIVIRRYNRVYHPLMLIAFLADPQERAARNYTTLTSDDVNSLEPYLVQYTDMNFDRVAYLLAGLHNLRMMQGPFSSYAKWNGYKSMTVIEWWNTYWYTDEPAMADLSTLCMLALSVAPTTGAAERNWSSHGFIQNLLRNSLTNPHVTKLVYMFCNLRLRNQWMDTHAFHQRERDNSNNANEGDSDSDSDSDTGDDNGAFLAHANAIHAEATGWTFSNNTSFATATEVTD